MTPSDGCWCGDGRLRLFGGGYHECVECGTLVRSEMPPGDVTRVKDEESDLYGRRYWFSHQKELGLPDLEARSVDDLLGRNLFWLRTILRFLSPPADVLELGASHGGFVGLLNGAGFKATGLELSPWVVDFARENFQVPMLQGPLEDQTLDAESFDLVVGMDVLEHLPDPLGTVRRIAELLRPRGALLLQTPCRPAGETDASLRESEHRFLEVMLPEHLFLFSESSVAELLARGGLPAVHFEPALFAHYDMCLVASREPLERRRSEQPGPPLDDAETRMVGALLKIDSDLRESNSRLESVERELRERTESLSSLDAALRCRDSKVEELSQELESVEKELRERTESLSSLDAALRCRDSKVEELSQELESVEKELRERTESLSSLDAALRCRDSKVEELSQELESVRRSREDAQEKQQRLAEELESKQQQLARQSEEIGRLRASCERADAATRAAETVALELRASSAEDNRRLARRLAQQNDTLERRTERLASLEETVRDHQHSRIYRALVKAGRWRALDERLKEQLVPWGRDGSPVFPKKRRQEVWQLAPTPRQGSRSRTIAIDLTASRPGGENGGAKVVALSLVRSMARLAPEREFLLLTTEDCHEDLAELEETNVRRQLISTQPGALAELLEDDSLSLLFCPFTAPPWYDPRVPLVCLVHDLQFMAFPDLLSEAQVAERSNDFRRAVEMSQRIVTVSDFVRAEVLRASALPADRVVSIWNSIADRLKRPSEARIERVLAEWDLEQDEYLLYPANFWAHKNHVLLLVAFSQFRARNPGSKLQLVLTGAEKPAPTSVLETLYGMGLEPHVRVTGFVAENDLAALFSASRALVFPSLYEGFGIPVLEAMTAGRPVLVANVGSLPEVAGSAALYFDPRRPAEIAQAIATIDTNPQLRERLSTDGRMRSSKAGDKHTMARAYLRVFDEVIAEDPQHPNLLSGVFGDGWTGSCLTVSHDTKTEEVELGLSNSRTEAVNVTVNGASALRTTLEPGESLLLRCRFAPNLGWTALRIHPTFCPADEGSSLDTRQLGLQLWRCSLRGPEREVDLLSLEV